jgi:hypothetical protein
MEELAYNNWLWYTVYFLFNACFGAFVTLVFIVTVKQRGKIGFFLLPLALYLFLWNSWAVLRSDLISEHIPFFWIRIYWVMHEFLLLLMSALALVPFLQKDRTAIAVTRPAE